MAKYEIVFLWETVVSVGGLGPTDTVGFYTAEERAKECAALNKKAPFAEVHMVRAMSIEGEYFVGTRKVEVDLPPRVLTPRQHYSIGQR